MGRRFQEIVGQFFVAKFQIISGSASIRFHPADALIFALVSSSSALVASSLRSSTMPVHRSPSEAQPNVGWMWAGAAPRSLRSISGRLTAKMLREVYQRSKRKFPNGLVSCDETGADCCTIRTVWALAGPTTPYRRSGFHLEPRIGDNYYREHLGHMDAAPSSGVRCSRYRGVRQAPSFPTLRVSC